MTFQEFDDFQASLLKEVVKIKDTKGKEYASGNDRFANFNEDAKDNDIDRLKAAAIFLNKHMRSIKSFIRNKQVYSNEPIRGRIVDAITYLTLIAGMIEEATEKLGESTSINTRPFKVDELQQQQQATTYTCVACLFTTNNRRDLRQHYVVNPTHSGS